MPHFVGNIGENYWQYRKNIKKRAATCDSFFSFAMARIIQP